MVNQRVNPATVWHIPGAHQTMLARPDFLVEIEAVARIE